jgi:hypothetical protein
MIIGIIKPDLSNKNDLDGGSGEQNSRRIKNFERSVGNDTNKLHQIHWCG